MVDQSTIDFVGSTADRYRFQFRDPAQFDEVLDAPDWAQETAETISDGATVRMGRVPESDALQVASVAIPKKPNLGREEAKTTAGKIIEELHS